MAGEWNEDDTRGDSKRPGAFEVPKPTLKQWMIDMTGPEDAWAREQYVQLVIAALNALETADSREAALLKAALKAAGEIL